MSGGERQRSLIACSLLLASVLANSPTNKFPLVLLFDEPTAACDENSSMAVEGTLRKYCDQLSMSSILVTHDQQQIERIADRVISLDLAD